MTKHLLGVLVLGVLGLVHAASADTIAFTTSGVPNPINLGNGISVSYTGSSLSFNTFSVTDPFPVDYGTFKVNIGAGSDVSSITDQPYTIDLSVSAPGIALGSVVGEITGTFKKLNSKLNTDSLQFVFVPEPASIGPITFNILNIGQVTWYFDSTNIGQSGKGPTYSGDLLGNILFTPNISGAPPIIPLPASVFGGSALLGLIFIAKMRSHNKAA